MPQFRTRGKGKDRQVYPIVQPTKGPKLITTRLIDRGRVEEEAEPPVWLMIICDDSGGYDYEFYGSLENAEEREMELLKKGTATRILDEPSTNRYVKNLDDENLRKFKRARHEFKVDEVQN